MSRLPLSVFAVEDHSIQVVWQALPEGEVTIEVGPRRVTVEAGPPAWLRTRRGRSRRLHRLPGGPGAVVVDGLEPSSSYDLFVSARGVSRRRWGRVRTLAPPPGRLLAKFATVSDLHVGERRFGLLSSIVEERPINSDSQSGVHLEPYPLRCAAAAIEEAHGWGAELLVVKGDITASSRPWEFHAAGRVLGAAGMPVVAVLGNHDVRRGVDGKAILEAHGIEVAREPRALDLAGVRLVLAHSPSPEDKKGHFDDEQIQLFAGLVGERPGPVVIVMHHPPQRHRIPTSYPPPIVAAEGQRLLGALAGANPNTVLLAGHTHRNRSYDAKGVLVAEVGSTKDYPGQWAGYAVYEGGIRQVVRRISRQDVIAWTEATARAISGVWGLWSPGRLGERCWSRAWKGAPALPASASPAEGAGADAMAALRSPEPVAPVNSAAPVSSVGPVSSVAPVGPVGH